MYSLFSFISSFNVAATLYLSWLVSLRTLIELNFFITCVGFIYKTCSTPSKGLEIIPDLKYNNISKYRLASLLMEKS